MKFIENFKEIGKKGLDFVKTLTIGTVTSIKDDICQYRDKRKAQEEWWKSTHSSTDSEKSE